MKKRKSRFSGYVSCTNISWYFVGTIDGNEECDGDGKTIQHKRANQAAAKEGLKYWIEQQNAK
jgi:lysozyme family protein